MPLIVGGQQIQTSYETLDWINNPDKIKNVVTVGKHGGPRSHTFQTPVGVCLHNFTGSRQVIVAPGKGSEVRSFAVARMFANPKGRKASCHLIITAAGRVLCLADLKQHKTFHAGLCNDWSIGIEIQKDKDFKMYEACLDTAVEVCEDLHNIFSIPKIIPADNKNSLVVEEGFMPMITKVKPYKGFFGHRNCSTNRGPGDPGNTIFERLLLKGWTLQKY